MCFVCQIKSNKNYNQIYYPTINYNNNFSNSTTTLVISLISPLKSPLPSVKPLSKFRTKFSTADTKPSSKPGAANTFDLNSEISTLIYKNNTDARSVSVAYKSGSVQPKYGNTAGVRFCIIFDRLFKLLMRLMRKGMRRQASWLAIGSTVAISSNASRRAETEYAGIIASLEGTWNDI